MWTLLSDVNKKCIRTYPDTNCGHYVQARSLVPDYGPIVPEKLYAS